MQIAELSKTPVNKINLSDIKPGTNITWQKSLDKRLNSSPDIEKISQSTITCEWHFKKTKGLPMLKINLNANFNNPIIQSSWENGLIPHFTGIIIGNGEMISIKQQYANKDNFSSCYITQEHEFSIDNFIAHSEHFVHVTVMINRVYIPEIDCYAICGEGQMGNEGFVALIKGETLIWSAFFTISNPFYEVKRIGDVIIAKSTHDVFWELPILEPWKARVLGSDFNG